MARLERWYTYGDRYHDLSPAAAREQFERDKRSLPSGGSCDACKTLSGTVWPAGEGLRPPLHWGCRCRRRAVPLTGLGPAALIRLALEARGNVRNAPRLRREALARIGINELDEAVPAVPELRLPRPP